MLGKEDRGKDGVAMIGVDGGREAQAGTEIRDRVLTLRSLTDIQATAHIHTLSILIITVIHFPRINRENRRTDVPVAMLHEIAPDEIMVIADARRQLMT